MDDPDEFEFAHRDAKQDAFFSVVAVVAFIIFMLLVGDDSCSCHNRIELSVTSRKTDGGAGSEISRFAR